MEKMMKLKLKKGREGNDNDTNSEMTDLTKKTVKGTNINDKKKESTVVVNPYNKPNNRSN